MASRDLRPRIELPAEDQPATPKDLPLAPCPEDVESLIPWLRDQFPETSPRSSDPLVVDRCIARSGCIDLINYIEAALEAARREQQEAS